MFGVMTGGRGHERQIRLRMRKGFQQWKPPEMEGSALESSEHPLWGGVGGGLQVGQCEQNLVLSRLLERGFFAGD